MNQKSEDLLQYVLAWRGAKDEKFESKLWLALYACSTLIFMDLPPLIGYKTLWIFPVLFTLFMAGFIAWYCLIRKQAEKRPAKLYLFNSGVLTCYGIELFYIVATFGEMVELRFNIWDAAAAGLWAVLLLLCLSRRYKIYRKALRGRLKKRPVSPLYLLTILVLYPIVKWIGITQFAAVAPAVFLFISAIWLSLGLVSFQNFYFAQVHNVTAASK